MMAKMFCDYWLFKQIDLSVFTHLAAVDDEVDWRVDRREEVRDGDDQVDVGGPGALHVHAWN